ncbi:hypothetical protein MUK42_35554 [Musa troglodytarum]|uniref:Uncharacterized protein n=1 Tax=Musa troglodytarum TaxID=320322 RepID=A0A9E7FLH0_9LILI|nr:hypothetical protein MUK42_35554 [Musa troglodytarum]
MHAYLITLQVQTQLMMDEMEELRKKERHLGEINKQLKDQLEAEGAALRALQGSWCSDNAAVSSNPFHLQPSHFHGTDDGPALHIGYQQFVPPEAGENSLMLNWVP